MDRWVRPKTLLGRGDFHLLSFVPQQGHAMARSLSACAIALVLVCWVPGEVARATSAAHLLPRLKPAAARSKEPLRVYRFVLLGAVAPAQTATAVIIDVSDRCWTSREFGFVEIAMPAELGPNLSPGGGIAFWNDATDQYETLGLEK